MKKLLLFFGITASLYCNAQTIPPTPPPTDHPCVQPTGTIPVYKQHNILLNQATYQPQAAAKTTLGSGAIFDTTQWNHRVDSTWGTGYSTSQKLLILNQFWGHIDSLYPCFVHLPNYNWDSIVNNMRIQITAGVSEGRFAGMINYLLSLINDGHTTFYDYTVNYPYEVYPALPLFRGESGKLGACITAINDTVAMVYDAYPMHPFGLVPGDIILGYNGYPWTQLLQTILRYQLPNSVYKGSTDAATYHRYIQAIGENWYLFDTINIKKCDGSIVNLPTSLMQGQLYQAFCTEQMPVPGVYKPNYDDYYNNDSNVVFGKMTGTNIGYVYMYDCTDATGMKLYNAVHTLIADSMVNGLILDIRTNFGGGFNAYIKAYNYLASVGTSWVGYGQRSSPTNRLAMYIDGPTSWYDIFDTDPSYFPHPIAILCGPNAVSAGDFLPVMFKHNPNVKLFGQSTAGAYGNLTGINLSISGFYTTMQQTNFFQASNDTFYLSHTQFPVDSAIWFIQDSVCAGKDNIVSTAVQWIEGITGTAVNNIEQNLSTISVYPNPTSNTITIDFANIPTGDATIQITDITGKILIDKTTVCSGKHTITSIDISNFASGIYLLKINANEKQVIRRVTKM